MQKILKQILYADDVEDIRAIAQVALEEIGGFTVKFCGSGAEVLSMVKDFKPDLFLLDVMMPGMDGPAILAELRKNPEFTFTPAIFMTAKIQSDEIESYKKLGVLDVIAKPFDPMLLSENIKNIWAKHYGK
jgi:CheY-like chemotaxis protein